MEEFSSTIAPKARDHGLVMRQLSDETLIYDLERDQAHCLSTVAGLVWNYCDGSTSIHAMSERLSTDLRREVDEATIWQALTELDEAGLLEPEAPKVQGVMSRRQMVATMGAALSIPLITSLAIPTAAMAASTGNCLQPGTTGCATSGTCCAGLMCSSNICCYQPGGQPTGFTCTTDSQCCAGYCNGGTCVACKTSGTPCSADDQCCQGNVCINSKTCGACLPPSTTGNGNNYPCTKNSDCCTGRCNMNDQNNPHCVA